MIISLNIRGEFIYDTNVIRGTTEKDFTKEQSRYAIFKDDKWFRDNTILGARIIIYKYCIKKCNFVGIIQNFVIKL